MPADPLKGVTVPNAFTPLTVAPISRPTFPFPGTDDKYHLAFDMQVTNSSAQPATLNAVDVVDGQDPTKVLASFSGNQLVDPTCNYGNCNRLRVLPAAPAPDFSIAPGTSRSLLIDFRQDNLSDFPKAVMLRFHGNGVANPASKEPGPFDTLGAPFIISAGMPRIIAAPLKGNNGSRSTDAVTPAGRTATRSCR